MNLYLKYRPRTIEELDLTQVREKLGEIVKSNKVAHAYLLTGPRGAGKTSSARILARVVNCERNREKLNEPCNECDVCKSILNSSAVDVIEIDAASNRGIDDVRELKEKIRLSPAILPKKVYIIDEVHMMTTDAFNALLKTLEEPPSHSLFILCTTESHKVPETISSRCVRIHFTKATKEEMVRSLSRVVKGEGAKVDKEALELLAGAVDGSFRDGVKILDQVVSLGTTVDVATIEKALYGASGYVGSALANALKTKDMSKALELYHKAESEGVDLVYLLTDLMKYLRDYVVDGQIELIELIYQLDEVARKLSTSPVPSILVEIAIIRWGGESSDMPDNRKTQKVGKSELSDEPVNKKEEVVLQPVSKKMTGEVQEIWRAMMQNIEGDSYSMGALLSKARPGIISGNELTIEVKYDFHREQIMHSKFRSRIEELVSSITGVPMQVTCIVNTEMGNLKISDKIDTISPSDQGEDDLVSEAESIFTN